MPSRVLRSICSDGWPGILGYILRKMDFPMSQLILGFMLGEMPGEMPEQSVRRAVNQQRQHGYPLGKSHLQSAAGTGYFGAGSATHQETLASLSP